MHIMKPRWTIILSVLLLFALVGAASALYAEGCKWVDLNKSGSKDTNELCQAGWTLHIKVTNATATIRDEDFVTNTAGTTGKFNYLLPVPAGTTTSSVTISEIPPTGYTVVVPAGVGNPPTYSYGPAGKTYTAATTTNLSGFSFGNQPDTYTAEGCYWIDANGDSQQATDGSEPCLAGKTLHANVWEGNPANPSPIKDEDFQTNTAGTGGKFSYTLPAVPY